ncbi:hypothetical protein AAC387_Pa05g0951 [Persea americana]
MCLTRTRSNGRILRCSGHRRLAGKPWADVYDSNRGAATPSRDAGAVAPEEECSEEAFELPPAREWQLDDVL